MRPFYRRFLAGTLTLTHFILWPALLPFSSCDRVKTSSLSVPSTPPPTPDETLKEDEIREAVFRYAMIWHGFGDSPAESHLAYLGVSDDSLLSAVDPSAGLMKRFAGDYLPVKRISQCRFSEDGRPIDIETGQTGQLYTVGKIHMLSSTEAELLASGNGQGCIFTLKNKHGNWEMTKHEHYGAVP